MKKIGIFLLMLSTFVSARYDAKPIQNCEAYNNMKHTKNTQHVVLDTTRKYTVLKHYKGQNLIIVKGETPAQRWVNDECFSKEKANTNPADVSLAKSTVLNIEDELRIATLNINQKPKREKFITSAGLSKQNLLALSWHNAFCETHRSKKECKRNVGDLFRSKSHEQEFVLHGLWPQPRNNVYCDVDSELINADKNKRWRDLPCLALDEEVESKLEKLMPGFASDLHKHEWVKHGTCYGTEANAYYKDAISLLEQVNNSALGQLFKENIGKRITLKEVRKVANKTFGKGAGARVVLKCKGGLVTELWLQLGSGSEDLGTLLHKGKKMYSRCKGGHIDKAGFTKETGIKASFGR